MSVCLSICHRDLFVVRYYTDRNYSGQRNVTVWHLSLCPVDTYRDSPGGSMRRGQRTFWPDHQKDRHTCRTAKPSDRSGLFT